MDFEATYNESIKNVYVGIYLIGKVEKRIYTFEIKLTKMKNFETISIGYATINLDTTNMITGIIPSIITKEDEEKVKELVKQRAKELDEGIFSS